MFEAGLNLLAERIPCIRNRLIRKIRDGFDDELFTHKQGAHVVGNGNDKYYSIVGALEIPNKHPN